MAEEKKNPLIGAFRTPPPVKPPTEPVKPAIPQKITPPSVGGPLKATADNKTVPPITTPADEKKSEEKKPSEQAIPTAQENKADKSKTTAPEKPDDKGKAVAPEKPDDKAKPATQEKPDDKSKSTVSEKPAAQDKSGKRLFSVNGHLLPNYRMEQTQPDQNMLDDLMSCLTIDDLVGKEQPARADGPLPKEPVSKTLTGPSDVPKAKSIRSAGKNKKRGHSR